MKDGKCNGATWSFPIFQSNLQWFKSFFYNVRCLIRLVIVIINDNVWFDIISWAISQQHLKHNLKWTHYLNSMDDFNLEKINKYFDIKRYATKMSAWQFCGNSGWNGRWPLVMVVLIILEGVRHETNWGRWTHKRGNKGHPRSTTVSQCLYSSAADNEPLQLAWTHFIF